MLAWVINMGIEKKTYSFRLDGDLMDILKELSEIENRSVSNYVETVLKKHIKSLSLNPQKNDEQNSGD